MLSIPERLFKTTTPPEKQKITEFFVHLDFLVGKIAQKIEPDALGNLYSAFCRIVSVL